MKKETLDKAKILFEEGVRFLQINDYVNAEIIFNKSLDLVPGRLSIIHNLISIYVNTNQRNKLNDILKDFKI